MQRWGIFIHDADGDSGYGRIVGSYRTAEAADLKADVIRRLGESSGCYIECIVVPVCPTATSARDIVSAIANP